MVASMSGTVAFEEGGADHHRHAGEADVVLQRDAAAGELAARLALDRRSSRTRRRADSPRASAAAPPSRGYFTGGLLVRHRVERRIGRDQRRDDVLHGVEIDHARIHAELLGGVAQIGDAGFLEHGRHQGAPSRPKRPEPPSGPARSKSRSSPADFPSVLGRGCEQSRHHQREAAENPNGGECDGHWSPLWPRSIAAFTGLVVSGGALVQPSLRSGPALWEICNSRAAAKRQFTRWMKPLTLSVKH